MLGGVSYEKVDDEGLHITVDGEARVLEVDNVVVCAGQEPLKDLEVCFVLYGPTCRSSAADCFRGMPRAPTLCWLAKTGRCERESRPPFL